LTSFRPDSKKIRNSAELIQIRGRKNLDLIKIEFSLLLELFFRNNAQNDEITLFKKEIQANSAEKVGKKGRK
jgi:hypothetical protein